MNVETDTSLVYTGTQVNYYFVCKRKLWLFSHALSMESTSDAVNLGKLIHETSYPRQKQEFSAPGMKIDLLTQRDGRLIVQEVKKSSKNLMPGRMQLAYYLWRLREMGLEATGELVIPKERKRIPVELTAELDQEVRGTLVEIERIVSEDTPLLPVHSRFCRACAYNEFCWT
ncbi:MAG TPA: CRISPR-associated protein Cas4 [Candidatus Acetothermia bacterium]|nr:CRISPR-associated protein Cas4 [Candidatus Acetothermia bacterium]